MHVCMFRNIQAHVYMQAHGAEQLPLELTQSRLAAASAVPGYTLVLYAWWFFHVGSRAQAAPPVACILPTEPSPQPPLLFLVYFVY